MSAPAATFFAGMGLGQLIGGPVSDQRGRRRPRHPGDDPLHETAPIAGLGGEDTAVPMALLMIAGAVLSLYGLLVLARPARGATADARVAA
jgi:MFS family permease